jgi:hypothetical protein
MGILLSLSPHLLPLMSSEDQARFSGVTQTAPDVRDAATPSPKSSVAERKEQGTFASWLLLQNSKGHKIPFCWHATHKPSKATPGTPGFWVGINGRGIWIEFKRDHSCHLTQEQEEFRLACVAQHIEHYVVYSADEAMRIVIGDASKHFPEPSKRTRQDRASRVLMKAPHSYHCAFSEFE